MRYRIHAATGRVTQRLHAGNITQRLDKRCQYRAVADQFAIKTQLFAQVKDSCAVIAKRTADQQHIAWAEGLCAPVNVGGDRPHSGRVDEQLVCSAALHDFGIAGHDGDACFTRGRRHTVDDGFQRLHRQTLFEDKTAGEVARDRAADRHVVSRTADGQLADIATREEQRIDNIAVG